MDWVKRESVALLWRHVEDGWKRETFQMMRKLTRAHDVDYRLLSRPLEQLRELPALLERRDAGDLRAEAQLTRMCEAYEAELHAAGHTTIVTTRLVDLNL